MKKLRCPRCAHQFGFDETRYPEGRVLIFTCPSCQKVFKIMLRSVETERDDLAPAEVKVMENAFHEAQTISLCKGENVIGRFVKGTRANAAFNTVDPSIDTTHCIITASCSPEGEWRYILRDAPSGTGTFYQNKILRDADRIVMEDGAIINIGGSTLIFNVKDDADA